MNRKELTSALDELEQLINIYDERLNAKAAAVNDQIHEAMKAFRDALDQKDGVIVSDQDLSEQLIKFDKYVVKLLKDTFKPSVAEYLQVFNFIDEANFNIQDKYNGVKVDPEIVKTLRQSVTQQCSNYLDASLSKNIVPAAKFLLMQQAAKGATIKEMNTALRNYRDGKLTPKDVVNPGATKNVKQYASVVTRDVAFQYSGESNNLIAKAYDFNAIIYTGNIIPGTRPFCRAMIQKGGKILIEDAVALTKKYPEGIIPGTNTENFIALRGGFACRHLAVAVRL